MCTMQLFSQSGCQSERAHSESQGRETEEMQTMRLYYNSVKQSEAPQKGPTLKKSHTGAQLVSFSATSQLNE